MPEVSESAMSLHVLRVFGTETNIVIQMPRTSCRLEECKISDKGWDGKLIDKVVTCNHINFVNHRNHIQLKSILFVMLMSDLSPVAAYNVTNTGKVWLRYGAAGFDMFVTVVDSAVTCLNHVITVIIFLLQWLNEPDDEGVTKLEHLVALSVLWFVVWIVYRTIKRCLVASPIRLTETVDNFTDSRIIGEKVDNTGHSYILLHNNTKYIVKKDYNHSQRPQDEMALPGSDLYPSAPRPVGAILVSNDGITYQVVGCFFRYENSLVTARHVATLITSGIAKVKLSGTIRNKRGNSVLDDSVSLNVDSTFFDEDKNLAKAYTVDLFVCDLEPKVWAKLQINKIGVRVSSKYDLCVSLVGFQNGILITSNGKTLRGSGGLELHYNASTVKGFSGAPVFSGNSVVGMHYLGDVNHNSAIRREMITPFAIRAEVEAGFTSSTPSRITIESDVKSYGDPYEDYYGRSRFLRDDGSITSDYSEDEMERYWELERRAKKLAFGDEIDYYDEDYVKNKRKSIRDFEDQFFGDRYESAPLPTVGYEELSKVKAVHCAPTGVVQDEAISLLDEFKDDILKCGFEEDTFRIPVINKENEVTSLKNHLRLWSSRVSKPQKVASEAEIERLLSILEARININYEPDENYDSIDYILDVINTSSINDKKSAGRPYQADGMATIGDVLKKYGPDQFAEIVLRKWRESFEYKLFLKNEPHKIKKIEAEMLRIITCMPVHKLVKNNCIFRNYLNKTSEAWRNGSVMFYGFNPTIPNATEKLRKRFEGKILHGSDKTNWDFSYFGWIFDIYKQYHCRIVRKPRSWDEERFDQFKSDVCQTIDEVYKDCVYTTSDGRRFKQVVDGIMKSGWFMTIDANTFAQIVLNTLALMRCGVSDDDILNKFDMVAGGDDDLDSFPDGFDTDQYYAAIKDMGIDVEPDTITTGLIGNEFYSNTFRLDPSGVVSFHPVRFTKHIYKLRLNKLEDLPQALNSHMQNYCWSPKQFRLFESMYAYVINKYNLPDVGSRSMIYWRYKNKGLEIPSSL